MKSAAKIAFSLLALTALGFCVAFVLETLWRRAGVELSERRERSLEKPLAQKERRSGEAFEADLSWRDRLKREAGDAEGLADQLMGEGYAGGGLLLEVVLEDLSEEALQGQFVELMARDLDDYRALEYAGRVLEEIARRDSGLAVALLGSLTPAERERLAPSLARGWTSRDPDAAFEWIAQAWVREDGTYIDRALQNQLYVAGLDTLVSRFQDYERAAAIISGVADPLFRAELVDRVAHRIVRDGPENALDRLSATSTGVFDASIMEAVATQWAARDSVGAAQWVIANEEEMSNGGVRSIAKQLVLEDWGEELTAFHRDLRTVAKRDAVAAEAARLKARREPELSAKWVAAIEQVEFRTEAVYDALYEIGYEDFGRSVGYIDRIYEPQSLEREPVVYATLRDWLDVDLEAVAGYLGSGRANLSTPLSEELLLAIEAAASG